MCSKREANNPMHKNEPLISVLVDGRVPHFSRRLVGLLEQSGVDVRQLPYLRLATTPAWIWRVLTNRRKIVHLLQGHYPFLVYLIPLLFGKKLVVHWIGTDVRKEVQRSGSLSGRIRHKVFSKASMHLTDFEPLKLELQQAGIETEVLPLVPVSRKYFEETNDIGDDILAYVPEFRSEFYRLPMILDLAKRRPDLHFHITAHSGSGIGHFQNVTFHGWTDDLETLWLKCRVLLRMTEHDGLSHSVVEALSRGKHVIWTQPYPCCRQAINVDEALRALEDIWAAGRPNLEGREYVRRMLDPQANLDSLIKVYERVLKR